MAARRILRLAEREARWLRPLPRPPERIGQWRDARLKDLPDWSFADGRPSPPWRGQIRRRRENGEIVLRIRALSKSLEMAKKTERDLAPPPRSEAPPTGSPAPFAK